MLAADGYVAPKTVADPVKAAGYHRVGESPSIDVRSESVAAEISPKLPAAARSLKTGDAKGVTITPFSEGYYELCIKSVEAVNYDPMEDENGPESEDM
jgi:NADH dehydrogenase [ubiquinone] 1 alpha subcomplex assembly factor 1